MRGCKVSFLCLGVMCAVHSAEAQGTFQNLNFESATLAPISSDPPFVQFAPAFPGWTGYVGTNQAPAALYNYAFLDTSAIGIIDRNWTDPFHSTGGSLIEGRYTALLQAGVYVGTFTPADITLSQTAIVPASAQSLRFKLFRSPPLIPFGLRLGGQSPLLVPLASGTNYTIWGADVRSWAGQLAQLDIIAFASRPHTTQNYLFLDSIEFSDVAIPEPRVWALVLCGAALFGLRCWRRKALTRLGSGSFLVQSGVGWRASRPPFSASGRKQIAARIPTSLPSG